MLLTIADLEVDCNSVAEAGCSFVEEADYWRRLFSIDFCVKVILDILLLALRWILLIILWCWGLSTGSAQPVSWIHKHCDLLSHLLLLWRVLLVGRGCTIMRLLSVWLLRRILVLLLVWWFCKLVSVRHHIGLADTYVLRKVVGIPLDCKPWCARQVRDRTGKAEWKIEIANYQSTQRKQK